MTAVLYDTPGPRGRARNRLLGIVGTVVILAIIAYVLYRFVDTGQFAGRKWSFLEYRNIQLLLLTGLWGTISAFVVAAVLSLLFGAVFATGRMSEHAFLRGPSTAVVEFFRAVPLLVLIFILYFGVSKTLGLNISAFWSVVVGLVLYNGSVLAEIFRAGVRALPGGQSEAAYALGMRKTQVMTAVLLPQAVRSMLPTIISQLVVCLKDTALGFLIGYVEMLYQARLIGSQGQISAPILQVGIVVGVIYIAMCSLLSWLANYLDKRTRLSPRRGPTDPTAQAETAEQLLAAQSQKLSTSA